MTQQGTHTWDLVIDYQFCPHCGYIIESRDKWEYRHAKYQKDLECPRCHTRFTLTKQVKPTFGPLFGEPEKADFDWS